MANDFEELYRCLRLAHYRNFFAAIRQKPGSLTSSEAFSAETIYLLQGPTIGEFADFLGISQPNASYKANALAAKGYIVKEPCQTDRRECRLLVTPRFLENYDMQVPSFEEMTADLSEEEKAVLRKAIVHIIRKLAVSSQTDRSAASLQTEKSN
ncbi:MAG: MarR family winged helix-turn-helix transcriptional regulator [Oscillospiraceae bacterium]|jgi:DNA-binding MarR family transcriptional regulator